MYSGWWNHTVLLFFFTIRRKSIVYDVRELDTQFVFFAIEIAFNRHHRNAMRLELLATVNITLFTLVYPFMSYVVGGKY